MYPTGQQIDTIVAAVIRGDKDFSRTYSVNDGTPFNPANLNGNPAHDAAYYPTVTVSYSTFNGRADPGTRVVEVGAYGSDVLQLIRINGNWIETSTLAGTKVTTSTAEAAQVVTANTTPVVVAVSDAPTNTPTQSAAPLDSSNTVSPAIPVEVPTIPTPILIATDGVPMNPSLPSKPVKPVLMAGGSPFQSVTSAATNVQTSTPETNKTTAAPKSMMDGNVVIAVLVGVGLVLVLRGMKK